MLLPRLTSQTGNFSSKAELGNVVTACVVLLVLSSLEHAESRVSLQWNSAILQGLRAARPGPPAAARSLAVLDTCIYNAWAAYDDKAMGTQLAEALRRPASERTLANKQKAISYAAYRALSDLFPSNVKSVYRPLMRRFGYDPDNASTDIETPAGIGNVACAAVLEFRHHDKANQLGDLAPGPYTDWSGYRPVNSPGTVPPRALITKPLNPEHWQPLTFTDATGTLVLQMFEGAQWGCVLPFALGTRVGTAALGCPPQPMYGQPPTSDSEEFHTALEPPPAKYGSPQYQAQAEELIAISAGLTDRQKMLAEYWSDGAGSVQTPERWMQLAQFVSERDHHSLDDDVKMFFVLSNAMLDASIAAWDSIREYDSVRPVTAIPLVFRGKIIHAWGGPGKGTVEMDGSQWIPYEPATWPTPPYPEYVSATSTFSATAARILELWTGSDHLGYSTVLPRGGSRIEPGQTPVQAVELRWETFQDAVNDAGLSGLYAGIHFRAADRAGRTLGGLVADKAWSKAQTYFTGHTADQPAPLRMQ